MADTFFNGFENNSGDIEKNVSDGAQHEPVQDSAGLDEADGEGQQAPAGGGNNKKQTLYDRLWEMWWNGEPLDYDIGILCEYYNTVKGDGHIAFLQNHEEELIEISAALERVLPYDYYYMIGRTIEKFLNDPDYAEYVMKADAFFAANESTVVETLRNWADMHLDSDGSVCEDEPHVERKEKKKRIKLRPRTIIIIAAVCVLLLGLFIINKIQCLYMWNKYIDNDDVISGLTYCCVATLDMDSNYHYYKDVYYYGYKDGYYLLTNSKSGLKDDKTGYNYCFELIYNENGTVIDFDCDGTHEQFALTGGWFSVGDFKSNVEHCCSQLTSEYRSLIPDEVKLLDIIRNDLELAEFDIDGVYVEYDTDSDGCSFTLYEYIRDYEHYYDSYDSNQLSKYVQLYSCDIDGGASMLINEADGKYVLVANTDYRFVTLSNVLDITYEKDLNATPIGSAEEFDKVMEEHGFDMTYSRLMDGE